MKYNQPYGISDPQAPYINGNPSTGTMGSIPPAASIEYPQREIVNLISDAGLVPPDNADLHQLAKAVQSMLLNAQDDAGTANAYQVTMHPAPTAYYKYLMVIMKVGNSNTGPSVLNVNAMGAKSIVNIDGTVMVALQLRQNAIVCLMYDGANFQLVWTSIVAGAPIFLTASRDFYVNGATGNDAAYDGTTAAFVAGTIHGPFKTLQRAADETVKYNLNGFSLIIHVADNNYAAVVDTMPTGSGTVSWVGNTATPSNCVVNGINKSAFTIVGEGSCTLGGFKLITSGSNIGDPCCAIFTATVRLSISNMEFGQCSGYTLGITRQGSLAVGGNIIISGSSIGNAIAQSAFLMCFYSATVETAPTLTPLYMNCTAPCNFGRFIVSQQQGTVAFSWTSFTGFGNITGGRYFAQLNGVVNSAGGGANYYPGNAAGAVISGGQYA